MIIGVLFLWNTDFGIDCLILAVLVLIVFFGIKAIVLFRRRLLISIIDIECHERKLDEVIRNQAIRYVIKSKEEGYLVTEYTDSNRTYRKYQPSYAAIQIINSFIKEDSDQIYMPLPQFDYLSFRKKVRLVLRHVNCNN